MQPAGLLVVGLDPQVEEIARRILQHAGAQVDAVQSAEEALQLLRRRRYRVIVSDRDAIDALLPIIAMLISRPVVIVAGENRGALDADLVTMVVPPAYDAHMLVGVVLACLNTARFPLAADGREGIGETC